jgi:hypothetical protein
VADAALGRREDLAPPVETFEHEVAAPGELLRHRTERLPPVDSRRQVRERIARGDDQVETAREGDAAYVGRHETTSRS